MTDDTFLDDQVARARKWMLDSIDAHFCSFTATYAAECPVFASVLERAFFLWFQAYTEQCSDGTYLIPQYQVTVGGNNYRLDFVIAVLTGFEQIEPSRVAVELDGHTFHEKTLEQVTRRNQRDRDLQAAGWTVLHFSFSEFTHNPVACVEQCRMAALKWWGVEQQLRQQLGRECARTPLPEGVEVF